MLWRGRAPAAADGPSTSYAAPAGAGPRGAAPARLRPRSRRRRPAAPPAAAAGGPFGDGDGDDFGASLRRWVGLDPAPAPESDATLDLDDGGDPSRPRRGAASAAASDWGAPDEDDGAAAAAAAAAGEPAPPTSGDADWGGWAGPAAAALFGGGAPPDLDDPAAAGAVRDAVIGRRQARAGRRTRTRDEYLRPIVDVEGIRNRLAWDEREAEERVFVESITNQYESREALRYAALLVAAPLAAGFVVSRAVAAPLWDAAERLDPSAFALSDEQKVEAAAELHGEEVRLRLEAAVGQAPALTDDEMVAHLAREARAVEAAGRDRNRRALLNVVSDSLAATVFFVLLAQRTSARAILFRTVGRVFDGMSDTAKAFLIILVTDTLLGYHSEEGWTAALRLAGAHYGMPADRAGLQLFVATVPVLLDSLFKYWIFVELNKVDPAAAVTLKNMDRH